MPPISAAAVPACRACASSASAVLFGITMPSEPTKANSATAVTARLPASAPVSTPTAVTTPTTSVVTSSRRGVNRSSSRALACPTATRASALTPKMTLNTAAETPKTSWNTNDDPEMYANSPANAKPCVSAYPR